MPSEANKAANARYDKKMAKYISMKLNKKTDADILEHLGKIENVQGYLKQLIRNDMEKKRTGD